jgi:hypothetical protein
MAEYTLRPTRRRSMLKVLVLLAEYPIPMHERACSKQLPNATLNRSPWSSRVPRETSIRLRAKLGDVMQRQQTNSSAAETGGRKAFRLQLQSSLWLPDRRLARGTARRADACCANSRPAARPAQVAQQQACPCSVLRARLVLRLVLDHINAARITVPKQSIAQMVTRPAG